MSILIAGRDQRHRNKFQRSQHDPIFKKRFHGDVKNAYAMRVSSRSRSVHCKRDDTLSAHAPAFQDGHASTLVTQKNFFKRRFIVPVRLP
jgi:hypothetical protein